MGSVWRGSLTLACLPILFLLRFASSQLQQALPGLEQPGSHPRHLTADSSVLSAQLCGAEEYFCGGTDVVLDSTFAAATDASTACEQDKGGRN